jgi:hypothetical protein
MFDIINLWKKPSDRRRKKTVRRRSPEDHPAPLMGDQSWGMVIKSRHFSLDAQMMGWTTLKPI